MKSFNGHHLGDEVGCSFVFSSAPAFFCLHGKQSRQGPPVRRMNDSKKRSFEKRVSAPYRTSKHGFEKRSFEKPLSAPYSFLNKAHLVVLIPAVLKTIARFKKKQGTRPAHLISLPARQTSLAGPQPLVVFLRSLALPLRGFFGHPYRAPVPKVSPYFSPAL